MLEVDSLAKAYVTGEGTVEALGDLTFSVAQGEFLCVVGPSGAGKTTLLKCLAGLLAPTDGDVRLDGEPVRRPPAQMGFVFQDYTRSLLPWLRVDKNVTFPLRHRGVDAGRRAELAEETLRIVGLAGFERHYPWQLSGGMQQRVAIARALAYQPEILLMDEPFASVDAQTRADLEDLVLDVWERYAVTIVFVTHDIDESVYLADRVLVLSHPPATVAREIPVHLPRPRDQIETKELPESLLVLGGGAIGLELAQAFARFGSQVTVAEAAGRLLSMEEPEASELVADALAADGVHVHVENAAAMVSHDGREFAVTLEDGTDYSVQRLLVSVGRRAQLGKLGVETVGLDPTARAIEVDEWLRAGEKLWAVGDVTGRGAFTHVAMYQAAIVVRDILGQGGPPADYAALPRVTFTDPEIGAVGMTQAQAEKAGIQIRVGVAQVPSTSRGWIHKAGNAGMIKLIEDADRGVLVGATSAGPNGGEVLGALAVAVHGGVPVERLRHMIYAYPTFHRGIEDAVRALA
jgi:ABC-type nitrate/sulfonate/bicarbonate transport system ATPase subunit